MHEDRKLPRVRQLRTPAPVERHSGQDHASYLVGLFDQERFAITEHRNRRGPIARTHLHLVPPREAHLPQRPVGSAAKQFQGRMLKRAWLWLDAIFRGADLAEF